MPESPRVVVRWAGLVSAAVGLGLAGLLSGCAHLIPTGKVVDEARYLGPAADPPAPAGERLVEQPVLPFAVWGLYFDEELVIELKGHETWRMIEVVRLEIPDEGEVWFTLDSHRCGRQWVGARPEHLHYAAGCPAPTYESDFEGERTEDERAIRYEGAWTLSSGERVTVEAESPKPVRPFPLRNGNAMNHSQETALALIDLEYRNPLEVAVTVDGEPWPTHALSRSLLIQVAAGVMEGRKTLRAGDDGGLKVDLGGKGKQAYRRVAIEGGFALVMEQPTAVETWRFVERDGAQHATEVELTHRDRSLLRLRFNPPLPDLRALATETTEHRLVASVNGQPGYLRGVVEVGPGEQAGTTELRVMPARPSWARERPARVTVRFPGHGAAVVDTAIEPTRAWSFGDVACPDGDDR